MLITIVRSPCSTKLSQKLHEKDEKIIMSSVAHLSSFQKLVVLFQNILPLFFVFEMSKDHKFAIGMATHSRKIAWSFMEWLIRCKYWKIKIIWMYIF